MSDTQETVLDRFYAAATSFMTCVDSASTLEPDAFLIQAGLCLAELYCAALYVPVVEPESEDLHLMGRTVEEHFAERKKRCSSLEEKLGARDTYWVIFDSTKQEEPVQGSLANDITDIYLDLKRDLQFKDKGIARADRIFQIYLSFREHWARHAIHALSTIHDLRLNDPEWLGPDPGPDEDE
jgi:hypothetical protein